MVTGILRRALMITTASLMSTRRLALFLKKGLGIVNFTKTSLSEPVQATRSPQCNEIILMSDFTRMSEIEKSQNYIC